MGWTGSLPFDAHTELGFESASRGNKPCRMAWRKTALMDNTGLYYYRARYYNPHSLRFLSEDPTQFAGGINVYRYVGNNPISYLDPFGLDRRSPCATPWNRVAAGARGLGNVALGGAKILLGIAGTAETGGLAAALGYYSIYSGGTNIVGGGLQLYGALSGNLRFGQTGSDYASSLSTVSGTTTLIATGNAKAGATASTIEGLALVGATGGLVSTGTLPAPSALDNTATAVDNGAGAADLILPDQGCE